MRSPVRSFSIDRLNLRNLIGSSALYDMNEGFGGCEARQIQDAAASNRRIIGDGQEPLPPVGDCWRLMEVYQRVALKRRRYDVIALHKQAVVAGHAAGYQTFVQ
jgi:hypothetical protein